MNILSLDGGGIFGCHTAVVLEQIEKSCPGFLEKTDLIAGTSIGGIMALGLANNCTIQQIIDLFYKSSEIFSRNVWRRISSNLGWYSYYNEEGRRTLLESILQDKKLGDLSKKVVIQSFEMNTDPSWTEKLFHNIPNFSKSVSCYNKSCTMDVSAVDAGLATSAAPIYFPSYLGCIDGGVAQNNPSMTALAMTQDDDLDWGYEIDYDEIKLLSIGRVYYGNVLAKSNLDGGWFRWVSPLINILLSGNMTATDYQCHQFLGDQYCRIATKLTKEFDIGIDDFKSIPQLIDWSRNLDLSKEIDWVKEYWFKT